MTLSPEMFRGKTPDLSNSVHIAAAKSAQRLRAEQAELVGNKVKSNGINSLFGRVSLPKTKRRPPKSLKYLSVHEILEKSREWHAARKASAQAQPQWSSGYMRKQFPPSWFLSGSEEAVDYDIDSPIPLSYHGDEEVMSHLPDILRPRYPMTAKTTSPTNKTKNDNNNNNGGGGGSGSSSNVNRNRNKK